MTEPTLIDQADEADLHAIGLADSVNRAMGGKIKRPVEWVERNRARLVVAKAAAKTLRRLAEASP